MQEIALPTPHAYVFDLYLFDIIVQYYNQRKKSARVSGKLAPSTLGVIHALVQFVHGAERVYSHRAGGARSLIHCAAPRRRPTRRKDGRERDHKL